MHPTDTLRVLAAGASLRVGSMHPADLLKMAAQARIAGVKLEIKAKLHPTDMLQIAAAGGGHVLFDITS